MPARGSGAIETGLLRTILKAVQHEGADSLPLAAGSRAQPRLLTQRSRAVVRVIAVGTKQLASA